MQTTKAISDLRELIGEKRKSGKIVLVPTMGALHRGHASLLERGRELAGAEGTLVASVFVNPTQFGPNEDFESYPRNLSADAKICETCGVDIIFAPEPTEVYLEDSSITINESLLSRFLCGQSRPIHFAGVCLVVTKLFHMVEADIAIFGKKDYQQLAIIRRVVRDLNMKIEIVGEETVREDDGLALSSRNRYLDDSQRQQAPMLRKSLLIIPELISERAGEELKALEVKDRIREELAESAPLGKIDYIEIVDQVTLQPLEVIDRPALAAIAVYFGQCRLIDNIELAPHRIG